MATVERFQAAVEARDEAALAALLAPDVRFFSPVSFTPFIGAPALLALLSVLFRTFEDFRYVGRLAGTGELTNGDEAETHGLVFRSSVGGRDIHGIDLLQLDEAGLITEFTVMVRPKSAVLALGAAVQAGLVADGVIPAPA